MSYKTINIFRYALNQVTLNRDTLSIQGAYGFKLIDY